MEMISQHEQTSTLTIIAPNSAKQWENCNLSVNEEYFGNDVNFYIILVSPTEIYS